MNYTLIPFLIVLALSLGLGIVFSKKAKSSSNYFLGDRSLNWFMLMMTFVATQVGGGFILGTAEASFEHGFFGIFYSLGQALGFLALGLGFGAKLQSLKLNTASDLFETYYGSVRLKKFAAALSIIALTGILIAQAVALRKFMFAMGLNEEWLFLASWLVVILYTTQGGFLAVVWTDLLQATLMIGILIAAFYYTLSQPHTPPIEAAFSASEFSPNLLGLLVMPFLFMFIEQDMVQRCFAGKNQKAVTKGALAASLVLFCLAIIPVYFGLVSRDCDPAVAGSSRFMEAISYSTNNVVFSCAACAVLLAIISTASSLLSAISSNIANDFTGFSSKPRTITFATGTLALVASHFSSNIFGWMIASYELAVGSLFIPLVVSVFLKERCSKLLLAAQLSCIFGCVGFVEEKLFSHGTIGLFVPLALSATGYAIGMILSKRRVLSYE
ncbi:MAG: sodium:solute symporter family protein [Verrucomicrobia bacterium]|nr:sodium:solute symporter family protein [Verrucomicrobiota bacterium]MBS0636133.1 sodium:solute symporter family protein [Verrucomicrobiota bacterium]